jgi:hypothetical protein
MPITVSCVSFTSFPQATTEGLLAIKPSTRPITVGSVSFTVFPQAFTVGKLAIRTL